MKKVIVLSSVFVLCAAVGFSANPFDEFKNQISGVATDIAQTNLDNFAADLGPLMGGGTFHDGKNLGFPGFDVGIHVPVRKVSSDNAIMKAANLDSVLLPVIQAEIGLPAKIDLLVRYLSYADATVIGGGVRYGIIKGLLPGFPSLSVQATYNMLDAKAGVNKLKATTMGASAIVSFNIPVVKPYLGIGYDTTSVEPDASIAPIPGIKGTAAGTRIEAGVNLSLIPLTYLQLGGTLIDGTIGYTAGFGIAY